MKAWIIPGGENEGVGKMRGYQTASTFYKKKYIFYEHHILYKYRYFDFKVQISFLTFLKIMYKTKL